MFVKMHSGCDYVVVFLQVQFFLIQDLLIFLSLLLCSACEMPASCCVVFITRICLASSPPLPLSHTMNKRDARTGRLSQCSALRLRDEGQVLSLPFPRGDPRSWVGLDGCCWWCWAVCVCFALG